MANLDRFIPNIWSTKLILELQKALVYGQTGVINRDYEGEIKNAGDTVRIHSFGDIKIFDYAKNNEITDLDIPLDSELMLKIDQSKAFNFLIDDIDIAQQKPKIMSDVMRDAAYRLADVADAHIAGLYVEAGITVGDDSTPVILNEGNIYDYLVELSVKLTEQNVSKEGRFVILPPWVYGLILKDSRFAGSGSESADKRLRNGQVGQAAGFAVLESNNVPNNGGEKYKILAGHSCAWSFADQILKVEAYRPEKRFADAVKGLHVYGAKVLRPNALACLVADKDI